jgi:hypothetical protein
MTSVTINPKPVIEIGHDGNKKIKGWTVSIPKKDLLFEIDDIKSETKKDLLEHPNLFGLAKELGISVPSEYYCYQVENSSESLTLTSRSIDVLKLAIGKVFENKHDKRLTIKRQWTINFREKKEEVNLGIGIFDNEDGDY